MKEKEDRGRYELFFLFFSFLFFLKGGAGVIEGQI